jgi:hypothetical protein
MGLDNISVYNRSQPLPFGVQPETGRRHRLDGHVCLEHDGHGPGTGPGAEEYEDMAIQYYEQFLAIANAIAGHTVDGVSLWDPQDGFFKDLMTTPDGTCHRVDVYSYVGLIPLFACEIVEPHVLKRAPRFKLLLEEHAGGLFNGHAICACPVATNDRGERLLSLVDHTMLPHILRRLLDQEEFLSPHGLRGVSRIHAHEKDLGVLPGIGEALIGYEPGESGSSLFGGNSNWRGPVWMPINYSILQALTKFHRYLGPNFTVAAPTLGPEELTLQEVVNRLADRLVGLFRRDGAGRVPSLPGNGPFRNDPHWRDLRLFHEYFHGENGLGLGASHQTGWTGLVANLIKRRYELKTDARKCA